MNNDQTVCSLYFLSEKNIILPPAELLVSPCLKARLVLQTCIVLIGYMCVCYVLGEGEGGQVSLLCSQRTGPDGP